MLHFQHFIIIIIIIIIMDSSTVLHFQYFILTSSGRIYAPRRDLAQRLSEENGDAATHSVWRIIDSRDKKIRFGREACVATGTHAPRLPPSLLLPSSSLPPPHVWIRRQFYTFSTSY